MTPLILLLILHLPASGFATESVDHTEMNGIRYRDYADFDDKWKLVTVRYRTDNEEQRFVWANPLAIRTLAANETDYPDGAVFAKIGFMTEKDAAFDSSRVPSGSLRYQFMVRDKKKYAGTGGWGYALFDAEKNSYEGDAKTQAQACYACHQIVADRGQVFSTPLKISAFAAKASTAAKPYIIGKVHFQTMLLTEAPEILRKSLPSVKSIRSVEGDLRDHVFRGTIDEIRPLLVSEVKQTGLPAALIGRDSVQFSAVYPNSPQKKCPTGKSMKAVFSTTVPSSSTDAAPYLVVAWQDLCV